LQRPLKVILVKESQTTIVRTTSKLRIRLTTDKNKILRYTHCSPQLIPSPDVDRRVGYPISLRTQNESEVEGSNVVSSRPRPSAMARMVKAPTRLIYKPKSPFKLYL
jgi:hypothetical protein